MSLVVPAGVWKSAASEHGAVCQAVHLAPRALTQQMRLMGAWQGGEPGKLCDAMNAAKPVSVQIQPTQ
jgi:hypothetical protein